METSKKIVIVLCIAFALLSLFIAFDSLALECPEGSKLIKEAVVSNGSVRKEHCRKLPKVLSKQDKIDKLNELRKKRPDLSKEIDDKIKALN